MMENQKIKNFTDLRVWQSGHELVLLIYRFTKSFPVEERYGLSDQLRRAAVSFTSNIAEGFGREKINDKAHFYTMALGSLYEVQNQLIIAKDLRYIKEADYLEMYNKIVETGKMTSALIKSLKNFS